MRLWRRYGQVALTMLDEIRRDPRMGELLIEGAEYIRVEIALGARREMITRLGDFLRRRSKIALVIYASTFPILLNTISGVRTVDPLLVKSARSLGLPSYRLFQKVILPAAVPTKPTSVAASRRCSSRASAIPG